MIPIVTAASMPRNLVMLVGARQTAILNITTGAVTVVNDEQVIHAMETHGGSFVRALARAARAADVDNFAKLKAAFPELWADYAATATLLEQRKADQQ